MVGIGFAFVENILYLAAAYNGTDATGPGGAEALTGTFILRCLVSPFAHPLFTSFIGIGVGVAVASRSTLTRIGAPILGYVLAVATHALWNVSTLGGIQGFFGVYVLLMVPALVCIAVFAVFARSRERRMLLTALDDASRRGLLPASDIPWLIDLGARRTARAHARAQGEQALEAMKDYQRAAIELGFLHHRFLRGTPPDDYAARGAAYLTEIGAVRPASPFPDSWCPPYEPARDDRRQQRDADGAGAPARRPPEGQAPARAARTPTGRGRRSPSSSTSSRTTSSRG